MEPRTQHEQEIMRGMGELLASLGFTEHNHGFDSNDFKNPETGKWVKIVRTGSLHDPIEAQVMHGGATLRAWNRKGLGIILAEVEDS